MHKQLVQYDKKKGGYVLKHRLYVKKGNLAGGMLSR